jgi:MFS family permease
MSRALPALAGAQLLIALDHNIVYVVLPVIDRELHFAGTTEQWVVSSYSLAFGGLLLVGGRLTDACGPRRVFMAALAVYAGASALGGLAADPATLVIARAGQGVGGALLFPATVAALKAAFPDGPERVRALAVWGAAGAAGGAAGSLVGGSLAATAGWRAVFLANLPLAALVAGTGVAVRSSPADVERAAVAVGGSTASGSPRRFARLPWQQLPSAVAGASAVALGLLAATQAAADAWPATTATLVLAVAATFGAAFTWLERRSDDPLLPVHVLRGGDAAAAVAVAFVFMATFGAQLYLLTVYLQERRGAGPLLAGVALLPLTVAVLAGTQLGGGLAQRLGDGPATVAALLVGAAGMLGCAAAVAAYSAVALVLGMVVVGLAQGATWTAMWGLATAGESRRDGSVAGIVATAQQIGGATGLALLVSLTGAGGSGIAVAYLAAAGLLAAAALLTPLLARAPRLGCG